LRTVSTLSIIRAFIPFAAAMQTALNLFHQGINFSNNTPRKIDVLPFLPEKNICWVKLAFPSTAPVRTSRLEAQVEKRATRWRCFRGTAVAEPLQPPMLGINGREPAGTFARRRQIIKK
jgi:hypothetical protein